MTEQILLDNDVREILIFHHRHFIESGLQLKESDLWVEDTRVDLLFLDNSGRNLYIDINGFSAELCNFQHTFKIFDILNAKDPKVRYMSIRASIPIEIKTRFDSLGIEYREYNDNDYLTYLRHHDPSLEKLNEQRNTRR